MKAEVLHGDCLELLPTLPDASMDMILADPPYAATACIWDSVIPLVLLWEQLRRIIKPRGAIVLCAKQPFTSDLIASNRDQFRYCWYWEKSKGANFAQTGYRPLAVIEEIVVFSPSPAVWSKKPTMYYYPQKIALNKPVYRKFTGTLKGSKETVSQSAFCRNPERLPEKTYTEKTPRNLLYAADDHEDGCHPCQKPTALMEYLIRTYTNEGETVLDFCMGSGTTLVAAHRCGRHAIGIEKELAYVEIARQRIATAQAELPLFAEGST